MKENNIIDIKNPAEDCLTQILRESAQKMLQVMIEQEAAEFVARYEAERLETGHRRVIRNGYLPKRNIQTGIGNVTVKMPRVRDKKPTSDKIEFYLSWIPKYMRRTRTIDSLLPLLYLKGISTGNFQEVLQPLLGVDAANISQGVISRLKSAWYDEYQEFSRRDLSGKNYAYFWADGIYLEARLEHEKSCVLVIVGVDETGKKELVSMVDGFRESTESWLEILRDLQERGLKSGPKLAIGDGALGFWSALGKIYPTTKCQRCWVHKTRNVLDKLPKSLQAKGKADLHEIYQSPKKQQAEVAFKKFISLYQAKYPKAADCLERDHESLLAFYDFPAGHWRSIRTTNPIESTFATVRHRTKRSKNCFSRETIIASVFKLIKEAEQRWKRLYGHQHVADVINLIKFIDGEAEILASQNQQINAA